MAGNKMIFFFKDTPHFKRYSFIFCLYLYLVKLEILEMTGTRIDAQSVTVQVKDLHFEYINHHYNLR